MSSTLTYIEESLNVSQYTVVNGYALYLLLVPTYI